MNNHGRLSTHFFWSQAHASRRNRRKKRSKKVPIPKDIAAESTCGVVVNDGSTEVEGRVVTDLN